MRLRRLLLHHAVFLSDYPPRVGLRYLGSFLYPGFGPLARYGGGEAPRSSPLRWSLQALHLLLLLMIVAELALRGLAGCPLRQIRWSG